MTRGAAPAASLVAIDRPHWWAIALAVFLLRGGILLVLLPIVILPTVAGLYNAFVPLLIGVYFGAPSDRLIQVVAAAAGVFLLWLLAGGVVSAWLELMLINATAGRGGSGGSTARPASLAWQALLIRLISTVPLVIVVGWGAIQLRDAAYIEVLRPVDVTVPLVLRVITRVPEVIGLLLVTWLAGETAGGIAVRRLALGLDASTPVALARGWLDLVIRPRSLAILAVTNLVVFGILGLGAATAGYAWLQLRVALSVDWGAIAGPMMTGATLLAFVAIWLSGLVLVAVASAWRSAAWTFEVLRRAGRDPGRRHPGAGSPLQLDRPAAAGR